MKLLCLLFKQFLSLKVKLSDVFVLGSSENFGFRAL